MNQNLLVSLEDDEEWTPILRKHIAPTDMLGSFEKKRDLIDNTGDLLPPPLNQPPPPPPPLVTHTTALASIATPITPELASDSSSMSSPSMGTAVLGIAVGSVAAFIILPALAVVVFLYIRRWRNLGNPSYDSLDDEHQGGNDEDVDYPPGMHHYRDEIQLKDYENESKPSFDEVGMLPIPASAVHVMPAGIKLPNVGIKALGSSTIRSPLD